MLNKKDIVILAKLVATKKSTPNAYSFGGKEYNYSDLNETLRDEFKLLAGTYNDYRRNKNDIFEIMQEVIDDVLPNQILARYGEFAEIKTFGQGSKAQFVMKKGRQRAKQFITKVGLAGIYEVFKLDRGTFDVDMTAVGGAAQVGLEEFLDGAVDFSELTQIVLDGIDYEVYRQMADALETCYAKIGASSFSANIASGAGWVEADADALLTIARAYGTPVIYTTLELAQKIVPAEKWVSDEMRNTMNNQGYVGIYKGTKVVVLPQSYTDETNTVKQIDPSYAYIFVAEGNSKPVKIAFEGQTIVDEYINADRSREIQAYKKLGVSVVVTNDMFVYEDTSL